MALIAVGISLLVITAGVFLLAKVNKEGLGVKYKIAGYGITLSGFVLVILSICMGVVMMFHHGKGHGKNYHGKKWKSHCSSYKSCKSSCDKATAKCDGNSGSTKSCGKKSACTSGNQSCSEKKVIKKIVKNGSGEEDINVEVIVE